MLWLREVWFRGLFFKVVMYVTNIASKVCIFAANLIEGPTMLPILQCDFSVKSTNFKKQVFGCKFLYVSAWNLLGFPDILSVWLRINHFSNKYDYVNCDVILKSRDWSKISIIVLKKISGAGDASEERYFGP